MSEENQLITPVQQMASSCVGACLVSLFMTPLDVVKIRLQTQDMVFARKCFLYSNGLMDHLCPRVNGDPPPVATHTREEICNCRWYNRPKYFNGTADALVKISKMEGITSLWSGLSPTLVLAIPTTVIYFTSYDQLRARLFRSGFLRHHKRREQLLPLLSGASARVLATTAMSPLELVRTKMQSKKMKFWQIRQALKSTLEAEGTLGLWKGCSPTILRDVPFSALYWPSYEFIKQTIDSGRNSNFATTFVSGALAGTLASSATLPMDVIKTRQQIELGETEIMNVRPGKAHGTLFTAREILRTQGSGGLFVGWLPRVLKVAPACAIMIASYEHCKKMFRRWNEEALGSRETIQIK